MNNKDLIARLEAAEKGARRLDYAIAWKLGKIVPAPHEIERINGPSYNETVSLVGGGVSAGYMPPHYTTSLDAALTLVPEDAEWEAGSAKLLPAGYWASVVNKTTEYPVKLCSTPALAVCIAALKALEAEHG